MLETVGILHWLKVLTDYITELAEHRDHVSLLFCTPAAKYHLPVCATMVHPLATSGKKEAVITELKDALLDFFVWIDQTRENYLHRLIMVGRDGLTYGMLLKK